MKKRIIAALLALSVLTSVLPAFTLSAGLGSFRYSGTQPLADNLTYTNTVAWRDDLGREEAFALNLAPGGEAYAAVAFGASLYGRIAFDDMIAEAAAQGKNVVAAINADFFSLQTGVPLGIVIDDYIYKSSPEEENIFGFRPDGTMFFTEKTAVEMTFNLTGGSTVNVTHLNKTRQAAGGMYILTEDFAEGMSKTAGNGWFVRLRIIGGELRLGGELLLLTENVFTATDEVEVGENCILLTGAGAPGDVYNRFKPGDFVTLQIKCDDVNLASARYALGGGDMIVSGGTVTDPEQWDKDLLVRSPKTAIGYRADGTVVALAVDGRSEKYANGLTLEEMAEEMLSRGCVAAMNLDGGGSTVAGIREPGAETVNYVNRPSDGIPRKCSTYLIFFTDALRDGIPRHIGLMNNGIAVLAGSTIELIPAVLDAARMPASVLPDDIVFTSPRDGAVSGNIYTASGEQGADRITVYAPSYNAGGWGEVFVVTKPTSVYFADENGNAISGMTISGGSDVQLYPNATYHRILLESQPEAFTFTVTGDIGEVTPDGMLHVSNGGTGTITMTAGEQTATIDVKVGYFDDMIGHWSAKYVHSLFDGGITNGVSDTEYAPEAQLKRGDFMLLLYRAVSSLPVPEPEPTEEPEPTGEPTDGSATEPSGEPTGDPSAPPSGGAAAEQSPEPTTEPSGEPSGDPSAPPSNVDETASPESPNQPSPDVTGQPTQSPSGGDVTETPPSGEPTNGDVTETPPSGEPTSGDVTETPPSGEPTGGDVTETPPSGEPTDGDITEPPPTEEPVEPPFTDVLLDAYYFNAIVWAKENGIAQGFEDGSFAPETPLTREQAFTFIFRALGLLTIAYESEESTPLDRFADSSEVADYAYIPAATLVALGVVEGSDGSLNPKNVLKRSEMAKLLCVLLEDARSF